MLIWGEQAWEEALGRNALATSEVCNQLTSAHRAW